MVEYTLTFYFWKGQEFSLPPGPEHWPEGSTSQNLPEDLWVDERDQGWKQTEPYQDPHGYIERFVATPLGKAMVEHLGPPFGVKCEGVGIP